MAVASNKVVVKGSLVKQSVYNLDTSITNKYQSAIVISNGLDKNGVRYHLIKQGNIQMLVKDSDISSE